MSRNGVGLPALMAWRYLRSRKSRSAVGAIAVVAVCGVAAATAAIICVLSVFNGFRSVLTGNLCRFSPDVEITPASGKVFDDTDTLLGLTAATDGVDEAWPVLTDNALAINQGREMPITLKGVDPDVWRRHTAIDSAMLADGRLFSSGTDTPGCILSVGAASQLAFYEPGESVLLFAPRRNARYNAANPAAAFMTDSVCVTGVFQSRRQEMDENTVICDLATARRLFVYESQASSIEVAARPGVRSDILAERLRKTLGDKVRVKDRLEQQQINFRMINIEKWMSFLLLAFILVIASFNIVSTMSMIVVEKQGQMMTLRALGLSRRRIGAIFGWESIYVTAIGGSAGLILGTTLCLLQKQYGLIRFSGDASQMIMSCYPVRLQMTDIVITAAIVTAVGCVTAMIASAFSRSRISLRERS